jgi:hypothetical protein
MKRMAKFSYKEEGGAPELTIRICEGGDRVIISSGNPQEEYDGSSDEYYFNADELTDLIGDLANLRNKIASLSQPDDDNG